MKRDLIGGSSNGQSNAQNTKGKKNTKKGQAAKNDQNDEVQIPQELKEVIEESDDEYPLHFDMTEELLEIFATLEEKNLFLIQ